MKPIIAIVGRPNVGKSTLFNRITHKKDALVDDLPGVTRDRHYADASWDDVAFTLVDTGGFSDDENDEFAGQIRFQVRQAIDDSDAVILVLDGKGGVSPFDADMVEMLRSVSIPVFHTVNKIDGEEQEDRLYDFYGLGIDSPYPISAEHGYGIADFLDHMVSSLPKSSLEVSEAVINLAVVGRPNVGKSSLVNRILGEERHLVSEVPGTTRDAVDTIYNIKGKTYRLIDTAGIRRKGRVKKKIEKFSIIKALRSLEQCDVALIVLDSSEGITDQDITVAGYAYERGCGCVFLLNKWDLVEKDHKTVNTFYDQIRMSAKYLHFAPVITLSALTGLRVQKVFTLVDSVFEQYSRRISTGELNRIIEKAVTANEPSLYRGKRLKFYYAAQVSTRPPTFVCFVNYPDQVHFSYRRYLMNKVREQTGLDMTPIRMVFRLRTGRIEFGRKKRGKKDLEERGNCLDLFEYQADRATEGSRPLADRMRPRTPQEFVGQQHIAGQGSLIRSAIEEDKIFSMILWGPPGCGKTTLAGIVAHETSANFIRISAVLSGKKEIRSVIEDARNKLTHFRKKTILFVDEIHRFNKAQQDAFLGHVENGLITLIGATTENPSFEVIPALLSRCRVIVLDPLSPDEIAIILDRALKDETRGLGHMNVRLEQDALNHLVHIADGDVRTALNGLEIAASIAYGGRAPVGSAGDAVHIRLTDLENALQKKALLYDKTGEEHYNLISAFHKSMRGSDPDASVYWLLRMLKAGEDPLFVGRRMVRFASEDVGNADPNALSITLNAVEAFRFLGHPEGDLALVQAAVYLATSPKSNSLYQTLKKVTSVIERTGTLPTPLHIRNAPTRMMKELGYGKGYKYAHDYEDAFVPESYLPEKLMDQLFYFPVQRGYEKIIKQRLDNWRQLKKKAAQNKK